MITAADIFLSKQDPWYFISNYCYTFDEKNLRVPIKPFPDRKFFREQLYAYKFVLDRDPGLIQKLMKTYNPVTEKFAIYLWVNVLECDKKLIAVPKSRQQMLSWIASAFLLWCMMFLGSQLWLWLSKDKPASEYQIGRIRKMYDYLDPFWQNYAPVVRSVRSQAAEKIEFRNGNKAMAFAQGPEGPRSYSPTGVIMDEAQQQTKLYEAIKAAYPATLLILLIGTANESGPFQRIVEGTGGGFIS